MKMTLGMRTLAQAFTVAVLLTGVAAQAQAKPEPIWQRVPSVEITYDYIGTNGPPGNCGCIGMNGGGVAYVQPIKSSPFSVVGGITVTGGTKIGPQSYNLTQFTYSVGARYIPELKLGPLQPYAELEVGGAHAGGTLTTAPGSNGISNAFAGAVGGGLNLPLHRRFSLKVFDAAYLVTTFPNGVNDHQNDYRISAGLIISLCSAKTCKADK